MATTYSTANTFSLGDLGKTALVNEVAQSDDIGSRPFDVRLSSSFSENGETYWNGIYHKAIEGFAFFRACDLSPPPSFKLSGLSVSENGKPIAGAPVFETSVSLDLVFDGVARRIVAGLGRVLPSIANIPIMGIGTPYSHDLNLAFEPKLDAGKRERALAGMLDVLEADARRKKADIVLLKDVSADMQTVVNDELVRRGYSCMSALPIARLRTPSTEAEYWDSLSGNMRSNLRRRLKRAKNIRIEIRKSADGIEAELEALRASTLERASTSYDVFEEVAPNFYGEVLRSMGEDARLLTYWLDDVLIGFSFVLLGRDMLVQTYNGMRYPEGPDNGLFYLDWMTQVRLCMEKGIPLMQSGVTTYLIKARLGCEFHRSFIYVRHRYRVMNALIRAISPMIHLEQGDPGLKELGESAPYV
ncbi:MAG: GNAT family N-acetyltransferase [Hyphomicrobiaceae bacterium]